ncbi:MAG: hypothetical protein KAJ56_01855, partial [Candidatus Aenigmarchaeota archaeon]|nr:hypothetical protein [Candidatus Aenigmarchaeota archaeon]
MSLAAGSPSSFVAAVKNLIDRIFSSGTDIDNKGPQIKPTLKTTKKHFNFDENPSFDFEYLDDKDLGSA